MSGRHAADDGLFGAKSTRVTQQIIAYLSPSALPTVARVMLWRRLGTRYGHPRRRGGVRPDGIALVLSDCVHGAFVHGGTGCNLEGRRLA